MDLKAGLPITVFCIALFLNGLRFAFIDRNPYADQSVLGIRHHHRSWSTAALNRMGWWQVIAALPVWFGLMALVGKE
jgi:hypothetical protein